MEFVAAGGVLGAYIAVMSMSGTLPGHWQQLVGGPNRVASLFSGDAQTLAEANDKRFAPFHFGQFEDESKVANRIRALSQPGKPAATYVLTDNQVIYILLDQKPPYHANAYNSSPIYEQEKVRRWLIRNTPKFVVIDPAKLTFDTFPTIIRVPIYFNHVIEHFVPLETVGALKILRRRKRDEPIAVAFWRETIGPTLDFGHFPRASSASALPRCGEDAQCQGFLKITVENVARDEKRLTIPFKANGQDFSATLAIVPGWHTYYLSLDRIWFWDVLKRHGIETSVVSGKLPSGLAVGIPPPSRRTRGPVLGHELINCDGLEVIPALVL